MKVKDIEILACKTFVCPNLSLIDEKGKILLLNDDTIKNAKNLAIEYFKKTYHRPPYSSAKFLLPAFIYITSVIESKKCPEERRTQREICTVFEIKEPTIRKWTHHIIDELKIDIIKDIYTGGKKDGKKEIFIKEI